MFGLPLPLLCFVLVMLITVIPCRSSIDIEKETEILLETDRNFAAFSMNEGTPHDFSKYLSGQALQFTGSGDVIRDSQDIYDYMKKALDSTLVLNWKPVEALVSGDGDLGYTWGKYTTFRKLTSTGLDSIAPGKYVNIWQMQPDGTWKVLLDIGNSN